MFDGERGKDGMEEVGVESWTVSPCVWVCLSEDDSVDGRGRGVESGLRGSGRTLVGRKGTGPECPETEKEFCDEVVIVA